MRFASLLALSALVVGASAAQAGTMEDTHARRAHSRQGAGYTTSRGETLK